MAKRHEGYHAENKKSGFYFHCHHDKLCEYVYDEQERIDYIKKEKPKHEVKTRLRLFKKIKGKLPKRFAAVAKKFDETRKKYELQLEELHKKECGCSEWNGEEIVFKEKEK